MWAAREENPEVTFPEHLHAFLRQKFQSEQLVSIVVPMDADFVLKVIEWAYNLVHALEQFKWDADCNIFLKIAREELPEEAASAQETLMEDVLRTSLRYSLG